ncbi:MAG: DNA-directed RNA polymerase subunit beta' [bacterium]
MWKSVQGPTAKPREDEIRDINRIRSIRITLASPETIRSWSYGEVKNPETIDYKTYKPKADGLFCERIFGPTRDYECACGKFKGIKHKGVTCDRCGVEVIQAKARRSRLGHIELEMPATHIWFSKGVPSRMAALLDMSIKGLERVLYYEEYIVLDPGETDLVLYDLINERKYTDLRQEYGDAFRVGMGAEAIREILLSMELEQMAKDLKKAIRESRSKQKIKRYIKRLKVVDDFRLSSNRPEWMVLEALPVIPPDLRPLVPLDGGRFATSDLNDLYRRVINRNNRLRRLKEVRAPEVIIRNEKRMLQEAVDALLDNGRRGRPVKGSNNRPLKSLSDMLKGKQGRFRQNLLGKRVDYSGRSVIVVGPELKFNQCGLPKPMALELFEPFVIRKLEELDEVTTIRSAKRKIERGDPEVYDVLEEVIQDHPILLNRAPTLHRMGFQAFQPILVEGKAIRLHPMTCSAFNADFDGDQMAVHVPLSAEAQEECRVLMLAKHNILSPAHGGPISTPTQDIVLGCYFLTKIRVPINGSIPRRFSSTTEAVTAFDHSVLGLQDEIEVRVDGRLTRTTVGRIIFNESLPAELRFVNELMVKKNLATLISRCYNICGKERTARLLDDLKDLGFYYAKIGGISIGLTDMRVPSDKYNLIEDARRDVAETIRQYEEGVITDIERYNKVIDRWIETTESVGRSMERELKTDHNGFNPIYIMYHSGARGSEQQIRQLAGMRGLMSKPMKKLTGGMGEIIESPIESNFKEGLTVLEYFISTHGARKGLADTALKTAEAGYLTRRLVDVAQDVIISEDDCGTLSGLEVSALREGDRVIESLEDRALGRVASEDVINPLTGAIIVEGGHAIDEEAVAAMRLCGVEHFRIRSVMSCESPRGACARCYGWDLSKRAPVGTGEAVGVIAAQSIGEPGTQLTLRTFHIGGTTSRILEQSEVRVRRNDDGTGGLKDGEIGMARYTQLRYVIDREGRQRVVNSGGRPLVLRSGLRVPRVESQTERPSKRTGTLVLDGDGLLVVDVANHKQVVARGGGSIQLKDSRGRVVVEYQSIPAGTRLEARFGDKVEQGAILARWDPLRVPIVADRGGKLEIEGISAKSLVEDPETGDPMIPLNWPDPIRASLGKDRERVSYVLMPGHRVLKTHGSAVKPGDELAYLPTPTIARQEGKLRYKDIIEGETIRRILDPASGTLQSVIKDPPFGRTPRLTLVDRFEQVVEEHSLPSGSLLQVEDGEDVLGGFILARTAQVVQQFGELSAGVAVGAIILLPDGQEIERRGKKMYLFDTDKEAHVLARWDPYNKTEVASISGICEFDQIIEGVTMLQRASEGGGPAQMVVMEHREDKHPAIVVRAEDGSSEYHPLPSGAHVVVQHGARICAGDELARIPKETFKSRDVTGGLPRVEEIFEARRPKQRDLAIITKLDGWVRLPKQEDITEEIEQKLDRKRRRGTRLILITDKEGDILTGYEVEVGKHVIVRDGDWVSTGTKLVDGSIDPHEYLEVMGEKATQEYLLNEVQEVYRLQGVRINDKHIEIIIRQMMRKVTITDPGDTTYLPDDDVDRMAVLLDNADVVAQGGKPAQFKPRLLGITKASLGTESFISAASFQETTRVLTQAAIGGKSDFLMGLKENVIMGHLIPAGTGWEYNRRRRGGGRPRRS